LKKNAQTFETRNDGVVSSQRLSKEEVFKAPTCQEAFFGKKGALLREEGPFTSGRRTIYFGKTKKNPLRLAIKAQRHETIQRPRRGEAKNLDGKAGGGDPV